MAKDRVRLSKVIFSSFLHFPKVFIFKMTNSDQALSWLLRHNAEKEGFVFLEGGFLPVQEVLKHKRCYFSVKQFLSKHFPDFEAGVIHWKMSRLLWLNVPNKGSRSKQAKRWVQNIILKWNLPSKYFFAQGALLIRANQGHSISTVEVIKKLLLYQSRKFCWFQCRCCDGGRDGWRHNSFGDKKNWQLRLNWRRLWIHLKHLL